MVQFEASLENVIAKFVADKHYQPMKQHELARALSLTHRDQRASLRHTLRKMEQDGRLVRLRKNRWAQAGQGQLIKGVISVTPKGFGIVTTPAPENAEIFIPKHDVRQALHGDTVMVRVSRVHDDGERGHGRKRRRREQADQPQQERLEGRITRILDRFYKRIPGLLRKSPYYWYVIPHNPRILQDIQVHAFADHLGEPCQDHKVVVELDPVRDGGAFGVMLKGVVVEDLGPADDPEVEMLCVLRDHQVVEDFPEVCEKEARAFPKNPSAIDLEGRRDLRDRIAFTIDPDDAKDYDDAVSLERLEDGGWRLGVHIADVPHYVKPNSKLDHEAERRGNSVYLIDRCISMLPRYLTSEVCSLLPHVPRLTHSVDMILDQDGNITDHNTFSSVIESAARLTYKQVQQLFDGQPDHGIPPPVRDVILPLRKLVCCLRKQRIANGSLDIAMPEVTCRLDTHGRTTAIVKRTETEAYQLIEECMLMANQTVARAITARNWPNIYRIHDEPSEEQWLNMGEMLHALGIGLMPSSRVDINKVMHKNIQPALAYTANLAVLRNMKRALYSPRRAEHFGLAFTHYSHFTSPIRRYPDLVVHRILNALETRHTPPYSNEDLARIATHCSKTEYEADQAEQDSVAAKRLDYYERLLHQDECGPYDAVVVNILKKGLLIELLDTLQQGLVPFASMLDDHYTADESGTFAMGRRRRKRITIGDEIKVLLSRVDPVRKHVDFELADDYKTGKNTRKKQKDREQYPHRGKKQRG